MKTNGPNKFVLLLVVYLVLLIQFGLLFAIGATFLSLLEKYGEDRSRTAIAQSVFLGLGLGLGTVGGVLIDKFGLLTMSIISSILSPLGFIASYFATSLEVLYITMGLIAGTGVCFGNLCSSTAMVRAFSGNQRALYLSIAYSAPGVSSIVYPYFIDWSIDIYGINGTWLLIGGLFLNSWPLPVLIAMHKETFEDKSEKNNIDNQNVKGTETEKDQEQERTCCEKDSFVFKFSSLVKNLPYVMLLLGTGSVIGAMNGYMALIFDISAWKGFSDSQTLLIFVPYAVFNTVSRIFNGVLKQKKGINSYIYPMCAISGGIVAYLLNYFSFEYWAFLIGVSLIGISNGGTISATIVLAVKLVEPSQQTIAPGILFTLIGIVSIGTSPLFGMIRDMTGSYAVVTILTVVMYGGGLVCFGTSLICRRKKTKTKVIYITRL